MIVQAKTPPPKQRPLTRLPEYKIKSYCDTSVISWDHWFALLETTRDHYMDMVQERNTFNIWAPQPDTAAWPTVAGMSIYSNYSTFLREDMKKEALNYIQNIKLHFSGDHKFNASPDGELIRRLINFYFVLAAKDAEPEEPKKTGLVVTPTMIFNEGERVSCKDGRTGTIHRDVPTNAHTAGVRWDGEENLLSWVGISTLRLLQQPEKKPERVPIEVLPEAGDVVKFVGWAQEAYLEGYNEKGLAKIRTMPTDGSHPFRMNVARDQIEFVRPFSSLYKESLGAST